MSGERLTTKTIKPGDIFYQVDHNNGIIKYEYVSVFPLKTLDSYHLLIDRRVSQPVRMFEKKLQEILDLTIRTYIDAIKLKIKKLKDEVTYFEARLIEFEEDEHEDW